MSECLPRVFNVTLVVPVTVRLEAADEETAQRNASLLGLVVLRRGEGFLSVSTGFPQEITVKEVVTNE